MASVGTGQYLVDGTHGAAVVPSKWPRWLYGAINPERTLWQALPVSLTTKITARTSEAPSQPGAVPLGSNYLSTTASQSTLQEIQKNPRDEPGRSHLKSPTSSWKTHEVTHHNKSVSFISSLKLVNLHTAQRPAGEGGESIPLISLHRGMCTALFTSGVKQQTPLAGEKCHVTCENDLCIYGYGSSWGDQRETMTRGVKDNVNRAADKYFNDFSLDHFGIMNESMGSHRAWMETSDWTKGGQWKPERLSELLDGL